MTRPTAGAGGLRIVVFGLVGGLPIAGLTAHYLQYVLGLRALGHDVHYVEDVGWFYDPASGAYVDEWNGVRAPPRAHPSRRLDRLFRHHGLRGRWSWVDVDGSVHGTSEAVLEQRTAAADLLVHVTGAGKMRDRYLQIPHRAYVDTDPGYIQMRTDSHQDPADVALLASHTSHFTYAGNTGTSSCTIPDLGLVWHPTRQPLHLPLWPVAGAPDPGSRYSTIVKWSPYEPVVHRGVTYGMKDVEFVRFVDLPARSAVGLELAMDGAPPVPRAVLVERGWHVRDGEPVSRDLDAYRRFISSSRGEWSVAKHGYVATGSGWFSDRSASYLAMGRPVVVQSTGFERWLPTGEGVVSFTDLEEAVSSIEAVERDHRLHSRRAREVAVEHFDARTVLADLVDQATAPAGSMNGSGPRSPS